MKLDISDEILRSMLGSMLNRQRQQQANFFTGPELSETERRRVVADLLLGLHSEVGELQRLIHRSYHVLREPTANKPSRTGVAHELIDCLKYLLAIASTFDIEADELIDTFWRVTSAVDERWRCERTKLEGERVIVIDIDGCLANFFDGFCRWFAPQTNSAELNAESINEAWVEPHKHRFYASGGFSELEPLPGAAQVVRDYQAKGFKIVIITARPRRRHANVESETIAWLREHRIPFDLIVFKRDKAEAICEHVFPASVFACIEDMAKHAVEIAALDVPVLLMPSEVNDAFNTDHPLITKVESWGEIRRELRRELGKAKQ